MAAKEYQYSLDLEGLTDKDRALELLKKGLAGGWNKGDIVLAEQLTGMVCEWKNTLIH